MTNLLIVEDDDGYSYSLMRMLSDKFKVHSVPTLGQALAAFTIGKFNAILLDIGLPDSPPDRTVNVIKKTHPECAIVVLSGYEDPERIKQCIHDSASSYLIKGRDDQDAHHLERAIHLAIHSNDSCQKVEQVKREIEKGTEI